MKRFTMLLLGVCLFSFSIKAQMVPTNDLSLKKTLTGNTVSEIAPYGSGFIMVSTDGTNDFITSTTDGTNFMDVETLELGSAKRLAGWADSDKAFYLGHNTSETPDAGKELRLFDGTSASYIFNHDPVANDLNPVTNVLRVMNGDSYYYHYLCAGTWSPATGTPTKGYLTDGTDGGTFDLIAPEGGFGPSDEALANGKFEGAAFNGKLYYEGKNEPLLGFAMSSLYAADGVNLTTVYTHDSDVEGLSNMIATSSHLYFYSSETYTTSGNARVFAMGTDDEVSLVTEASGTEIYCLKQIMPQTLGNKVYAVAVTTAGTKLVEMNGTSAQYYHLNNESESDNIVDMVVSGDYVYVLASTTGNETELFVIKPSSVEPAYVNAMAENISPSDNFSMLTAINGGVAFTGNDWVYVSSGNPGTTKSLMPQKAGITNLFSTADKLYVFANNGADTEIYEYTPNFSSKTITITVMEDGTTTGIQYMSVSLTDGLENYSGSTDADGNTQFSDIPYGNYEVSINGGSYVPYEGLLSVNDFFGDKTFYVVVGANFMINVYDAATNAQLADVTVEYVNTADQSSYSTTIVENRNMYMNNILTIPYGTYNVTITRVGYTAYTEEGVVVDANTQMVNYNINQGFISFYVRLFDNSRMPNETEVPAAGGGTVTLTNTDDPTMSYEASVIEVPMDGYVVYMSSFEDIPYGNYSGIATADGFEDASFTLVLNDDSNFPPHPAVYMDPIPTGIEDTELTKVRVYPNPADDFIQLESANAIQSVEIYSVNGTKVKALNNEQITQINISELPKGLYLVATTDSNGQRQITKINKR
ncbi:T9SS type A sorting domain-containing protein [Carboxylicivirga sediminis]|uniref:T9SS type A sorting domain-containing protein n=1 Tax=Carboxylicivirga sediminis TaxID=2006564 RepID=A0A941IYD9_9BACT|nr:T9SS type A sorting domain-containing protein [Carboxylicivirga sediminis]MBR8536399.1 T9SS type A sorting domain-containing protein [Carboxylicivirga sediminis]